MILSLNVIFTNYFMLRLHMHMHAMNIAANACCWCFYSEFVNFTLYYDDLFT